MAKIKIKKRRTNIIDGFDMADKVSNVFGKPCYYCLDRNYLHPNCPWYSVGYYNPASTQSMISNY